MAAIANACGDADESATTPADAGESEAATGASPTGDGTLAPADAALDVDASDAGGRGLVIHTRAQLVFLGDGSIYRATTDGGNVVIFSDPDIGRPQQVSEIVVTPSSIDGSTTPQFTAVNTLVGVETDDVWMPSIELGDTFVGVIAHVTKDGTAVPNASVSGTAIEVPSRTDDGGVAVTGYDRSHVLPASVCAQLDGGPAGARVDAQAAADIQLDHPMVETLDVTVDAPPGDEAFERNPQLVDFAPGLGQTCSVGGPLGPNGASAYELAGVDQTPPFDTFRRYVRVHYIDDQIYWPVPVGATSAAVAIPKHVTITAPSTASPGATPPATAFPFIATWKDVDPRANVVRIWIGEEGSAWGTLNWYVYLPPNTTTFAFFPLPSGAPVDRFPSDTELFINVNAHIDYPPLVSSPLYGPFMAYDAIGVPSTRANTHGRFQTL